MAHALITGGTSGIGLAITQKLLTLGHQVSINGLLSEESPDQFLEQLPHSGQAHFVAADLSQADQLELMVRTAQETYGPVQILINCAGIQHVAPVEEFSPERWNAIIGINLSAAFHTIRLTTPDMKREGWGRIVNIASAHALVASPYKSAYVAAKHGLLGLTKTVALELATFGVTCTAICPGYVRTPLVEAQIPATAKARNLTEEQVIQDVLLKAQPTKQFVTSEQIAETTAFLLTPAANNITGTAISLDGGWTAQ